MPTLLIWRGYRFRFYSSDREDPPHVHIVKDGNAAKVWLDDLAVAYIHGYDEREVKELVEVVARNRGIWIGAWNEFFGL